MWRYVKAANGLDGAVSVLITNAWLPDRKTRGGSHGRLAVASAVGERWERPRAAAAWEIYAVLVGDGVVYMMGFGVGCGRRRRDARPAHVYLALVCLRHGRRWLMCFLPSIGGFEVLPIDEMGALSDTYGLRYILLFERIFVHFWSSYLFLMI